MACISWRQGPVYPNVLETDFDRGRASRTDLLYDPQIRASARGLLSGSYEFTLGGDVSHKTDPPLRTDDIFVDISMSFLRVYLHSIWPFEPCRKVSSPSAGVGYKVALMIHQRCKPCLCLFRKEKGAPGNPSQALSPMLRGDRNLDVCLPCTYF